MTRSKFVGVTFLVLAAFFLSLFYIYGIVGWSFFVFGVGPLSSVTPSSTKTWQAVVVRAQRMVMPPFLVVVFHRSIPSRDRLAIWFQDAESKMIASGCDEPQNPLGILVISNIYYDPQRLRAIELGQTDNKNFGAIVLRCVFYALLKPKGASLFLDQALSDTYNEFGQLELVRLK